VVVVVIASLAQLDNWPSCQVQLKFNCPLELPNNLTLTNTLAYFDLNGGLNSNKHMFGVLNVFSQFKKSKFCLNEKFLHSSEVHCGSLMQKHSQKKQTLPTWGILQHISLFPYVIALHKEAKASAKVPVMRHFWQ
jgi:hypothetical protein